MPCDLADKAAVDALVAGCDAIVHLGGVSVERPSRRSSNQHQGRLPPLRGGTQARREAHDLRQFQPLIGFYRQTEHLDTHAPRRPDGYYGLSKSFGEDVAQFYFDR